MRQSLPQWNRSRGNCFFRFFFFSFFFFFFFFCWQELIHRSRPCIITRLRNNAPCQNMRAFFPWHNRGVEIIGVARRGSGRKRLRGHRACNKSSREREREGGRSLFVIILEIGSCRETSDRGKPRQTGNVSPAICPITQIWLNKC